jgi:hypothetical protein
MPNYRTAAIVTLVAVATVGLDIGPGLADRSHGLTYASVAKLPSQIVKPTSSGSPPARIGNIWGGFDHQPTSSEVQDREKAAGISLSATKQEQEAAILNDIYKQLVPQRPSATAQSAAMSTIRLPDD